MSSRSNYFKYSGLNQSGQTAPSGRSGGLLNIIGALTGASNLTGGEEMDQWGNPVYNPVQPKNSFWDYFLTGGEGARRAQGLNDAQTQLQQGLKLAQLQQQLDLEKERLRAEEARRTIRVQGRQARKTGDRASDVGLAAKDGVTSAGLPQFASRLNPLRTGTASTSAETDALMAAATLAQMRGQQSPLASKFQPSLDLGLAARMQGGAPEAFSRYSTQVGPGGVATMPDLMNPMGQPGLLEGSNTTRSQTEGGIKFLPGGGMERTPGGSYETLFPANYMPPPTTVDPSAVLKGREAAAGRMGSADVTQPEAPSAPPMLSMLEGLDFSGRQTGSPTAEIVPNFTALMPLIQAATSTNAPAAQSNTNALPGIDAAFINAIRQGVNSPSLQKLPNNALSALLNALNVVSGNPNRRPYQ